MYKGTRKIVGSEYKRLCETMTEMAENDALPVTFKLEEIRDLSCQDIGDLCNEFERDTDLEMTAHVFVCHDCGRTHIIFEVDYKDDEEDEDTSYLQ